MSKTCEQCGEATEDYVRVDIYGREETRCVPCNRRISEDARAAREQLRETGFLR